MSSNGVGVEKPRQTFADSGCVDDSTWQGRIISSLKLINYCFVLNSELFLINWRVNSPADSVSGIFQICGYRAVTSAAPQSCDCGLAGPQQSAQLVADTPCAFELGTER